MQGFKEKTEAMQTIDQIDEVGGFKWGKGAQRNEAVCFIIYNNIIPHVNTS